MAYPRQLAAPPRGRTGVCHGKPGSDSTRACPRADAVQHVDRHLQLLYGVQLLFSEDMGAGFARAVNRLMAAEWLDRSRAYVPPSWCRCRMRTGSGEINRVAPDRRFVQIRSW